MTRGFVIGKFYPPHRGHSFLIETALANADAVTVAVCDHPSQLIPAALRAAWLREMHPAAAIIVVEDLGHDDDSAFWAGYTRLFLGFTPDIVFTSEDYGHTWAHHLGCRHVQVDKARVQVPVSGTAIRHNPYQHWQYIGPPVRAFFARRVCVLGAESTGSTTLARALAAHFHTAWVPEVGRLYSEGKWTTADASLWTTPEFTCIAETQNRLEDQLARLANRILICDTNSFATRLWHQRYTGALSPEADALAAGRRYDLYLLTAPDIPFVQDGLRDGEHIRHAMHQRFVEELDRLNTDWLLLTGTHEQRMATAIPACQALLTRPFFP
ncbi:MAG: AAA family ATPase [Bryobacterales bacterium]|nr:AAA family ATPase [Bryobacterales bacterium]